MLGDHSAEQISGEQAVRAFPAIQQCQYIFTNSKDKLNVYPVK